MPEKPSPTAEIRGGGSVFTGEDRESGRQGTSELAFDGCGSPGQVGVGEQEQRHQRGKCPEDVEEGGLPEKHVARCQGRRVGLSLHDYGDLRRRGTKADFYLDGSS